MTLAVNIAQGGSNNVTFRNKIINGACVIDQRNAGASVTPASGAYTLDRWQYQASQASKFTVQQNAGSVTPPSGFTNYLGATVASAVTVGTTDYFQLLQPIEGFNTADLDFGKSTAKTVTLSFWVRSSLTGTFGGALRNSAGNYCYPFSYSISSANTWTQISITVTGPTAGTWIGATNGAGLIVNFSLGMGSTYSGTAGSWAASDYSSATGAVSVVGTSGATFYITGVQLEAGTTASPFEYRQYGTELQLCQRYCVLYAQGGTGSQEVIGAGMAWTSSNYWCAARMPVTMRSAPTMSATTGTNYWIWQSNGVNSYSTALTSGEYVGGANLGNLIYNNSTGSGISAGQGLILSANGGMSGANKLLYTAEL